MSALDIKNVYGEEDVSKTLTIYAYGNPIQPPKLALDKQTCHEFYNRLLQNVVREYSSLPLRVENSNPTIEDKMYKILKEKEGRIQKEDLDLIGIKSDFVFLFEITRKIEPNEVFYGGSLITDDYGCHSTLMSTKDGKIIYKGANSNLAHRIKNGIITEFPPRHVRDVMPDFGLMKEYLKGRN